MELKSNYATADRHIRYSVRRPGSLESQQVTDVVARVPVGGALLISSSEWEWVSISSSFGCPDFHISTRRGTSLDGDIPP
jgi:hypothetical protein